MISEVKDLFLCEWSAYTRCTGAVPKWPFWYTTSVIAWVVCLPSNVSSFMALLSAANWIKLSGVIFDGIATPSVSVFARLSLARAVSIISTVSYEAQCHTIQCFDPVRRRIAIASAICFGVFTLPRDPLWTISCPIMRMRLSSDELWHSAVSNASSVSSLEIINRRSQ